MKIAVIYDSAYPWFNGGIERRRYLIIKKLLENNNEVHYFTMFRKGMPSIEFEYEKIKFHCIGNANSEHKMYFNNRRNIVWPLKFSILLLFKIFKYRFDFIDADAMPYLHLIPLAIYSKITKTKLIISWAEIWDKKYWINYAGYFIGSAGYFIEKLCSKITKYHIINSTKTQQEFIKIFNPKNKKIITFPCAISFNEINNALKYKNKKENIFLSIGRLIPEKRTDLAIKIIKNIKTVNIKLLVIGVGPEKQNLIKLTKDLKLTNKVRFISKLERKELISKLKSSKALLMMSEREGLSLITLEALALEIPVIISNKTKIPKEVAELCIKTNENNIKNLIEQIIKNNKNIHKTIIKNSKIAIDKFSDKNTIEIYKKLIDF
ncbi:glycosyltransferase family 4 protein [Candidatus Marsarchaeota archaeon]|nr:glycosyltransferase family 4 protein [Candidatus Marsarchaeota archaeon]